MNKQTKQRKKEKRNTVTMDDLLNARTTVQIANCSSQILDQIAISIYLIVD